MNEPHWFRRALDAPSEPGNVVVEGVNIHFETWGQVGQPGVVLIHGSNAHLEWWRFVTPYLADNFRVAALDSSGNGDSGWRPRYSGALLAEEVRAVYEAASLGPKPGGHHQPFPPDSRTTQRVSRRAGSHGQPRHPARVGRRRCSGFPAPTTI